MRRSDPAAHAHARCICSLRTPYGTETVRRLMNEHDDDLESQVNEHAEAERDTYPDTEEELDAAESDEAEDEADELTADHDESEL